MKKCDEIKAAIDRFPGINTASRTEIDGHVGNCEECASYKREAERVERFFHRMKAMCQQPPAIHEAYASLTQQTKVQRRQTILALFGLLASVLALMWSLGHPTAEDYLVSVAGLFFVCAGFVLVIWESARKARSYLELREDGDFVEDWKKEIRDKLKEITVLGPMVAIAACFLPLWVFIRDGLAGQKLMVLGTAAMVVSLFVLYRVLIELPQLKRELSLLEAGDL
jgi:cation transport ATPase